MLTTQILPAICRTFLHSIWQGIAAAILAGAVLALTRRSSPATRYNLLGGILLLCMLAASATLYLELRSLQPVAATQPFTGTAPAVLTAAPVSYWDMLLNYLNTHAPFIMLVWGLIFLFKCFRMGVGFYQIHYLRHHKNQAVGADWEQKMQHLCAMLGIRKTVRLLESALVQVPLTTGVFKPCIFVPLGLLTQLPADQVEAVLLHELAHIRRRDYFVNILQSFAESIFFFNPALLWISARLREEREACCDDVAIAHTPHKASYLQALVNFAGRSPEGQFEMAFSHKRNILLNRVKRMMTRENQKLTIMEKSALILALVAISAFSLVPDPAPPKQAEPETAAPFVVYKPTASPVIAGKASFRVPARDTVTPGNVLQHFSYNFDSAFHYNLNKDTFHQQLAFNYKYNNSLQQYDLNFQHNANVNYEVVLLKIDSAHMEYLQEVQIDPNNMQYLKKTQEYTYQYDSSIADYYLQLLKQKGMTVAPYSYGYNHDSLANILKKAYSNPDLRDTSWPRYKKAMEDKWRTSGDSSIKSKDAWRTYKDLHVKSKDAWKTGRDASIKSKDAWKTSKDFHIKSKDSWKTAQDSFIQSKDKWKTAPKTNRSDSSKPGVQFKKPVPAGSFDKPKIAFRKPSVYKENSQPAFSKPKVVFKKPQQIADVNKPRVIFKKPKVDSTKVKEVKPLPQKKKTDALEEKLPADLYNSLILPKQIDC